MIGHVRWWPRRQRLELDTAPKPIDQVILSMQRVSGMAIGRADALSVPAVLRGRNMICSVATLPLELVSPENVVAPGGLFAQIDPDVPNVVTLSQTIEDLLLDGISWWTVTARDFAGFPVAARHLDVGTVSVEPPKGAPVAPLPAGLDPRYGVVWVDGSPVPGSSVIRFDSPNPPVLKVAGKPIRRAILLDQAASLYADDPRPADYFEPSDSADEIDDDEVRVLLDQWKEARRKRATAYIPASLRYHTVDSPSPQQLQLVELSHQVSLDIANALGIDPEDLGLSTTSRTYSNDVDRRRNKLNEVLSPYMRAVTERLSMGDVTRRGWRARFNTAEYLMPNPGERWSIYGTANGMGAMTLEEIRQAEGMPPLPAVAASDTVAEVPAAVDPVDASLPAANLFDVSATFSADVPVAEFSVDRENRIIEGLALPYDVQGVKDGLTFSFDRGSLRWDEKNPGRVKLVFPRHGMSVGRAIQLRDTPAGLLARFKIGRGVDGDRALEAAEDGVFDGFSVGVDFDTVVDAVPDPRDKTVLRVRRADLRHVALTDEPVYADARVTHVAASRTEGGPMPANESTQTAGTTPPPTAAPAAPVAAPAAPVAPAGGQGAGTPSGTFSADQVRALLDQAHAETPTVDGPTPVNPTRALTLDRVDEPPSYTFDQAGTLRPGAHDFSTDLFAGLRGDAPAMDRVMEFVHAQFDVVGSNVATLTPARQRPDLYVDQRDFRYPVWDAINKGTLADNTPFVFPKFSTASGLVAAHVEGTEPTSGAFTATSQTVTPAAKSGKVKISREVWDAGGNPQVSALIWRQMTKAWFEVLEAAAVAVLDAATPASLATFTVGGGTNKQTLVAELEAALSALQFVRGGFTMTDLFAQVDLYQALVAAKDGNLRPYYASVGPQNARGTVESRFGALDVNGVTAYPTWALAATGIVAASSYLFDRESVHGWASAPNRIDITMTEVANVYIGLWGYVATAISDINGVREVIYDPAV